MTLSAARRAGSLLDMLYESDEAIALEWQCEIREHRPLQRR